MRKFFFIGWALIAAAGSVKSAVTLVDHFYLWPLVRFVGYSALFVYTLLMLRFGSYNVRSFTEEERK